jgi:D-glycero-alpha-D-manno-heptose 1-phosphate guanylyltransferase
MEAMILAGGRGTRLGDRLGGMPKPMALVGGRPFLEILLRRLSSADCNRIILSVGYRHDAIEAHFGRQFGNMQIDYVVEAEPLGTGGAIRRALLSANESEVMVLNGDTFLEIDYQVFLRAHLGWRSPLTVAAVEQQDTSRFGALVLADNRVVSILEKGGSGPGWINGGVYLLNSALKWPSHLPENFSFETDFLMKQVAVLRPFAFQCSGYFLDIGVPEDLDRAQHELVD